MMHIVYQRYSQVFTKREQIGYGIDPVIIFQAQSLLRPWRQVLEVLLEALQGSLLIPVSPTSMDVDHVRPDQRCQHSLVFQFRYCILHHPFVGRGKYDKLVRMEAEPDVMPFSECSSLFEVTENRFCLRQIFKGVAHVRMGEAGKKGGENAEGTDTVILQEPKGSQQAFAVLQTDR